MPYAMVASTEKTALTFAHAVSGKISSAEDALAMVALLVIALTVVLVACPRCLATQRPLHIPIARLRVVAAALVLAAILRNGCVGHAFATAQRICSLSHARSRPHACAPARVSAMSLRKVSPSVVGTIALDAQRRRQAERHSI